MVRGLCDMCVVRVYVTHTVRVCVTCMIRVLWTHVVRNLCDTRGQGSVWHVWLRSAWPASLFCAGNFKMQMWDMRRHDFLESAPGLGMYVTIKTLDEEVGCLMVTLGAFPCQILCLILP